MAAKLDNRFPQAIFRGYDEKELPSDTGMVAMAHEHPEYVHHTPETGWRVSGTRVSLDSVVHLFLDGATAEEIVSQFPALSLEQVYGAIAFYLRNREEVDRYLATQLQLWEKLRCEQAVRNDSLLNRVRQARGASASSRKTA